MATVTQGITAEEFARLPLDGPCELVRGKVVEMPPPKPKHGWICGQILHLIQCYLDAHDIGRVFCNDPGVLTERGPDTVRGGDVVYTSYTRHPKTKSLDEFFEEPELVFEVLSPGDKTPKVLAKVAEYLQAGVTVVAVIDPTSRTAQLYRESTPPITVGEQGEIVFDDILPGFRLPLAKCLPE